MSKKNQKLQQEMPEPTGIELLNGVRYDVESDAAVVACNDWLRLGSGRTIPLLLNNYQQQATFQRGFKPPSLSYLTLRTWSSNFDWPSRASEFDAAWDARKTAEAEAVMNYGLALSHERLRELYQLAALLKGQIYELSEPHPVTGRVSFANLWVADVRAIGSGEFAERVDIERFNSALLDQYRKVLEDIAKETGGRVNRTDITTGDQPFSLEIKAIEYRNLIPPPAETGSIRDSDPSGEN
jgi:hypothetical protein